MENIKAAKDNQNATSPQAQLYLMKSTYNKIQDSIQHLDRLAYDYENTPSKFNLSKKVMQSRISKIQQFKAHIETLTEEYNQLQNATLQFNSYHSEYSREQWQRGEDGEYD